MTPEHIFYAALPVAGTWIVWVSKSITTSNALIDKLDKLVDLLLEERLNAQGQNRG